jgi:DNA polymerase III subunit delta
MAGVIAMWHAAGVPPSPTTAATRGQAGAAPVTVIVGNEELLIERAVLAVTAEAAEEAAASGTAVGGAGPGPAGRPDVHDVRAADLRPGDLPLLTAPSLFGGDSLVIVRSAQEATKDVAAELARLAADPPPGVGLVLTHSGAAKNSSLLAGPGIRRIDCPAVKRFGERLDFLRAEFGRASRKADESGLRALLDAVGTDLRDLAAACSQLAADTTGVINQAVVARYYRGRAEATGFTVADRAVEGKLAGALEQLRWALATGVSPVLIASALAQGVRALGRVGAAAPGRSAAALAGELGMPPWKVDRVRQQLRGWTAEGVARAHAVVAQADAQVKGEGVSPGYALERAITEIVACRSAR